MPTRGDGRPAGRQRTTAIRSPPAAVSAGTALCKNEIICMARKDLHGITMKNIYRSLFLVLVGATQKELARQIRYLKVENEVLRSKLPYRVPITNQERNRLVRFGAQLGQAINHLVSIVHPDTLRGWIREERRGKRRVQVAPGRRRTSEQMRRLIVKLARETGWGYTRILGELKKLGTWYVSRNTVRNILLAHGL